MKENEEETSYDSPKNPTDFSQRLPSGFRCLLRWALRRCEHLEFRNREIFTGPMPPNRIAIRLRERPLEINLCHVPQPERTDLVSSIADSRMWPRVDRATRPLASDTKGDGRRRNRIRAKVDELPEHRHELKSRGLRQPATDCRRRQPSAEEGRSPSMPGFWIIESRAPLLPEKSGECGENFFRRCLKPGIDHTRPSSHARPMASPRSIQLIGRTRSGCPAMTSSTKQAR